MQNTNTVTTVYAPKPGRRKLAIALYLPPELVEQIDAYAKQSDVTRSWVVKQVMQSWCADQQEAAE